MVISMFIPIFMPLFRSIFMFISIFVAIIAFGKPAGHRWKPAREAEEKRRRRRRKEDIDKAVKRKRCMEGDRWKRREIAPREIDVHARWKPEREAEEKRIRRRGRRGRRRD
jgi:hypothetical protein